MNNINNILGIKARIDSFMPLSEQRTEFIEFNEDGITTSYKERGKRKILGINHTPLSKYEMRGFFGEIYDFIRNATAEELYTDDVNCEVEIIYSPAHREFLDGHTLRGNEILIEKIESFVTDHRK